MAIALAVFAHSRRHGVPRVGHAAAAAARRVRDPLPRRRERQLRVERSRGGGDRESGPGPRPRRPAAWRGFTRHECLVNDIEVFYERAPWRGSPRWFGGSRRRSCWTHSPTDYMEDHESTCRLAVSAAFSRGMRTPADRPADPGGGRPVTVYHAQHARQPATPLGAEVAADALRDVGGELREQKTALLPATGPSRAGSTRARASRRT